MARKRRIIHANYCYHVMLRGVNGKDIFFDDEDRVRFCLLLQYASDICEFVIHAFCLMSNHVHLIVEPKTKDLSTGMHRLAFRYAQYFNNKFKRSGYLFQSRYKAIIVQQGVYLRCLIRYIHRNPVRANLVKSVSDYHWSSHLAYMGFHRFTWLTTDRILPLFDLDVRIARDSFQRYTESEDEESKKELEEIRKSLTIGSYGNSAFIQGLKQFTEINRAQPTFQTQIPAGITLDMLFEALNKETGVSLEELLSTSRNSKHVDARAVVVRLILQWKLCEKRELAFILRRDPTSISRLEQRGKKSLRVCDLAEKIS